jgi:serine/threonine protein kinase
LGAFFNDGVVKVALEYMDMGTLGSIKKLAIKKDGANMAKGKPIIPEPVMAKIMQQILCG